MSENGYHPLALDVLNQKTFPGYGYWIEQGATTLWENWNGEGSQNHHMFGSVVDWFFRYLAGIQPDENNAGFRHFKIKPHFDKIDCLQCTHREVTVQWEKEKKKTCIQISLPADSTAEVFLPDGQTILIRDNWQGELEF